MSRLRKFKSKPVSIGIEVMQRPNLLDVRGITDGQFLACDVLLDYFGDYLKKYPHDEGQVLAASLTLQVHARIKKEERPTVGIFRLE